MNLPPSHVTSKKDTWNLINHRFNNWRVSEKKDDSYSQCCSATFSVIGLDGGRHGWNTLAFLTMKPWSNKVSVYIFQSPRAPRPFWNVLLTFWSPRQRAPGALLVASLSTAALHALIARLSILLCPEKQRRTLDKQHVTKTDAIKKKINKIERWWGSIHAALLNKRNKAPTTCRHVTWGCFTASNQQQRVRKAERPYLQSLSRWFDVGF